MIAQAVSLALTRSYLLVPGIFAFTCGELALSQRSWGDAERFQPQEGLYMRAQDGLFWTKF